MLRSLKIAVIALAMTGWAQAADSAAPAPGTHAVDAATASHLAAARDLLAATNAKSNFMAMISTITDMMVAEVKKTHPAATEQSLAAFRRAFSDEVEKETDGLMQMQAAVYAEHFSEAELKQMAAYYRTGVGKHYVDELPSIIKEISPIATQWGAAVGAHAAQRAMEKLQKEGITL